MTQLDIYATGEQFDAIKNVDAEGCKRCMRCRTTQPSANFHSDASRDRLDGLSIYCRTCMADIQLVRRYKISLSQFEATLAQQGGRCAICRTDDPGGRGTFHVDHDHACCPGRVTCGRCVRGLLCSRCNQLLSLVEQTPAWIESANNYLESHRTGATRGTAVLLREDA